MKRLSFSDEMMAALAAGRKGMTRRPVKEAVPAESFRECLYGTPQPRASITSIGGQTTPICSRFKVGELVAATCAHAMDGSLRYRWNKGDEWTPLFGWKPARFMPAALAPFVLRITDVKSERVQDITERDAKREGVELLSSYRWAFELIWTRLYGDGPLGWDENPWCWCIGFEIAERRI